MGKLAVIKTKQNAASVEDFINGIAEEQKRKDSMIILKLMEKAMKEKPNMWGSSIIGFGLKRYKSLTSGREVDWFKIGFSPRKTNFSLNLINQEKHTDALKNQATTRPVWVAFISINWQTLTLRFWNK